MSDSNPVLLPTIDRELMLPPGTAEQWSRLDGFPLAGEGVAVVETVHDWALRQGLLAPDGASPPEDVPVVVDAEQAGQDNAGQALFTEPAAEETTAELPEVEWVTIRVPVVRNSGVSLPARRQQNFSLRPTDLAIRNAWGDMLAGCQAAGVEMQNGVRADDFSKVFRFIGEQSRTHKTPAT